MADIPDFSVLFQIQKGFCPICVRHEQKTDRILSVSTRGQDSVRFLFVFHKTAIRFLIRFQYLCVHPGRVSRDHVNLREHLAQSLCVYRCVSYYEGINDSGSSLHCVHIDQLCPSYKVEL